MSLLEDIFMHNLGGATSSIPLKFANRYLVLMIISTISLMLLLASSTGTALAGHQHRVEYQTHGAGSGDGGLRANTRFRIQVRLVVPYSPCHVLILWCIRLSMATVTMERIG